MWGIFKNSSFRLILDTRNPILGRVGTCSIHYVSLHSRKYIYQRNVLTPSFCLYDYTNHLKFVCFHDFFSFPGNVSTECFDPSLAGTMVPPHTRRAGRYLLGPRLGVSPVKSIVQCLARLENTDQYFQVKLLTIFSGMGRNPREESQDEKQGKVRIIIS